MSVTHFKKMTGVEDGVGQMGDYRDMLPRSAAVILDKTGKFFDTTTPRKDSSE